MLLDYLSVSFKPIHEVRHESEIIHYVYNLKTN